jgi:Fe-S-cluster containining protein
MPQAIINIRVIEEGDDVGICPFATPICEIKNGKPVPIKGKDGNLVFGCAIHQKKPTICKLYPISRIIQIQEGDEKPIFKYVLVENPFCQQVISGQADLSEFIDKEDEDMSILWFVIAINLVRRFEPAKNQENYYRMYKIGELFYNFDKLLLAAGIPKENLHKERPTFTKIIEMLVNGLSSIEFLLKRKNVFQN